MARKRIDFYLDWELDKIFRAFHEHKHEIEWRDKIAFAWVMISSGCRISEAVAIRLDDCFTNGYWIRNGKGGKERFAELWPECQGFWWEYVEERQATDDTYLFPAKRRMLAKRKTPRRYLSERTADRWWKSIIQDLVGLRRYLPSHEGGRKTFITWCLSLKRMDMLDMQQQVGHASFRTTEQHYLGSVPGYRFEKPPVRWLEIAQGLHLPKDNVVPFKKRAQSLPESPAAGRSASSDT